MKTPYLHYNFSRTKLAKLEAGNIKTVIIITDKEQSPDSSKKILDEFSERGFESVLHVIENIEGETPETLVRYAEEIYSSFQSGGCLVISHGSDIALPVLGCFIIYSGNLLRAGLCRPIPADR